MRAVEWLNSIELSADINFYFFDLKPHSRSFFGGNVQLINDEEETYLVSRRRTELAYVLIEKGLTPRLPSSDFEWIKDQEKSLKGKKDSAKLSIDSILLRNFESKLEEDLISLNNLLFIQHRKFIETMPFKKSDSSPNKCLFDATGLDDLYGRIEFSQDSDYEGTEEDYQVQLDMDEAIFIEDELQRWTTYSAIYQPGYTAASALIFLEKFLVDLCKLLGEGTPGSPSFKRGKGQSILDGRLTYIKENYGIYFHLPPQVAEIIFEARIARNHFSHGNWEEIESQMTKFKASELMSAVSQIVAILFFAINTSLTIGKEPPNDPKN